MSFVHEDTSENVRCEIKKVLGSMRGVPSFDWVFDKERNIALVCCSIGSYSDISEDCFPGYFAFTFEGTWIVLTVFCKFRTYLHNHRRQTATFHILPFLMPRGVAATRAQIEGLIVECFEAFCAAKNYSPESVVIMAKDGKDPW